METVAVYNALGRPLRQNWGNGRITTYAYHPHNARLTQLTVSGNLLDLRYGYDRVGNITAITDTVNNNQVQTFGYDARDRLVWARTDAAGNGQYSEAYGYDRMGNIVTRTVGGEVRWYTYGVRQTEVITPPVAPGPWRVYLPLVLAGPSYPPVPPRTWGQPFAVLSTTAGFRAAYDPNGNMVLRVEISGAQRITYTQEYNPENRLVAVTTPTGTVQFRYDGDGNRVLHIGPEGTTVYIGDYYEKRGSVVTKYYDAGGQRVALRAGGTVAYLHGDHLGSATLTTGASGNWVGEARYTPYGEMRRDYPRGVIPTDRLYTGQRQETFGLYDYGARYYSPGLERWISADTMVPDPPNPQSLNRYAYVYNQPLIYVDREGHFPWLLPLVIAGGIVVGGIVGVAITPEWQFWNAPAITSPRVTPPTSEDMTMWLIDQMQTNAQSPVTELLRENWQSLSPANRAGALRAWTALVRTGAVWDFKGDILETRLPGLPYVMLGGQQLNYQAVANIHYGFVGRAAGFQGWLLRAGAGVAQWMEWHRKDPSKVGPWETYFDQPFDAWCVGFGIFLYDRYGQKMDELTPEAFAQALQDYIQQYGAPPPAAP
jgi:RHS repeat-associated protein